MENGTKKWQVTFDHKDGRNGQVEVTTIVTDSPAFQYGNGKAGVLKEGSSRQPYDLRYASGNLHRVMIEDYFGAGLIEAVEI